MIAKALRQVVAQRFDGITLEDYLRIRRHEQQWTLDEIGQELGVSREYVRQILVRLLPQAAMSEEERKALLTQQYVVEQWSIRQMAKYWRRSARHIQDTLRHYGIVRPKTPVRRRLQGSDLTYADLKGDIDVLYRQQRLSDTIVAETLGLTAYQVRHAVQLFALQRGHANSVRVTSWTEEKTEYVRYLWCVERISIEELTEILGAASIYSAYAMLRHHGIARVNP